MNTVIENEKGTPSGKRAEKGEPKLYEAMFLVDSAEATTDWDGIAGTIKNMLEKSGAEIVSIKKWDDRKLAYEINGKGKGAYILCYFKAPGSKLQDIDRDIHLSERIMRALVLCAENRPAGDPEKGPASHATGETRAQRPATEEQGTRNEEGTQTEQPETKGLEQTE